MSTNPAWQDATALWDSDVDVVLTGVLQSSSHISPCVTATQNYINSFKVFATEEKARGAKSLVASFNREALNAGNVKTHPTLSDVESATLFRLGIFQVEDAFHYIPDFQKKWNDWRDQLQTLLDACAQYATIREGYDAVVKDEAEY